MTFREKWSTIAATHQQNGQTWGRENGSQDAQKPEPVGTRVRSTCHTWFGRLAVTTRDDSSTAAFAAGVSVGLGVGVLALSVRATVVAQRCRPALASTWAILTLPKDG